MEKISFENDVVATCPECNTPTKVSIVVNGNKSEFETVCDCQKQKKNDEFFTRLCVRNSKAFFETLPKKLQELPWSTLEVKIKDASHSYMFKGNTGAGKTVNAVWIARQVLKEGKTARFVLASDLLNEMNDLQLGDESPFKNIMKYDLIILDDFAREKYFDFNGQPLKKLEHLFSLIYKLTDAKKQIIITTNPEAFEYLTSKKDFEAILDRLKCCKTVNFKGESKRGASND